LLKKQFLTYVGIGLVLVAIGVAVIFHIQRGAHIELRGSVLKVRTLPIDNAVAIAVIDFRFVNPADYPFIVRRVNVLMEDPAGRIIEGSVISESDAVRLFQYYPVLGQKFNESLTIRTKVAPRLAMDRMIGARFELSDKELEGRKRLTIRIEDVDGAISDVVEEARP
jgi:hypothetical protein